MPWGIDDQRKPLISIAEGDGGIQNGGVQEEPPPGGTIKAEATGTATPDPASQHRAGNRRLARWGTGRVVWVLVGVLAGFYLLGMAHRDAATFRTLTGTAVATVTGSKSVNTSPVSPGQLLATVRFLPRGGGAWVSTTVEPVSLGSVQRGQFLPVRYDPADPTVAAYNGPWGDAVYSDGVGEMAFAFACLALAVIWLLTGAIRLARMLMAANDAAGTEATATGTILKTWDSGVRLLRIQRPPWRADLEAQLLRRQPQAAGTVSVLGRPEPGQWLVARLPDGQLAWPATRAQPVLGTGTPDIPLDSPVDVKAVAAQRRLLAGYALLIDMVHALPPVTRRPPGDETEPPWWWFGAPRPVVRLLVVAHLRRRLRALAAALTRAAVLSPDARSEAARGLFNQASQECVSLAGTLPRRNWLIVAASAAATVLTIYTPFFPTPRIQVRSSSVSLLLPILLISLSVAVFLLLAFFHSVRCKRALFSPATAVRKPEATTSLQPGTGWDVYQYEKDAFEQAWSRAPREWEARPLLRWTVWLVYAGPIGAVIVSAYPWVALGILGVAVVGWRGLRMLRRRRTRKPGVDSHTAPGHGG